MESPPVRNPRRRRRRLAIVLPLLVFLAIISINAIAYMQARAMTHLVSGAGRTAPPESLTLVQKIKVIFTGIAVPRPVDISNPADHHLAYQTFRFGGIQNDDCQAWYIPAAHSRGLCIAFHGYTAAMSSLLPEAREFHDMGYDVMLVDFHGSGRSHGDITTLGYREADDVAAAVNFANQKWAPQNLILYGQSMGGAAILRAIAELNVHPSCIIIESTFDRLLSTVENRFHSMGLPSFPLARLLIFWGGEQLGYSGFRFNPVDYAASVHCPALVFQGGLDPRVTTTEAKNLYDHLAGPKQFELFDHSNHCGFLNDDPARWRKAISDFLQPHPSQPATNPPPEK